MTARSSVTVLLLAFVVASVAYVFVSEKQGENMGVKVNASKPAPAPAADLPEAARQVLVYYFHGNIRCQTCRTIEAYAYEAVDTGFPDEIKSHLVQWQVFNIEEPANRHFADEFQLSYSSVVIADHREGRVTRWINLEDVWRLVNNKPAFTTYIQEAIRDYLQTPDGEI